jgi:branched-chain amino acid transport system ATP-binding protein
VRHFRWKRADLRISCATTIIVEQNAIAALQLADRALILDMGNIVFNGPAGEVLEDEQLRNDHLAI